MPSRFTSTVPDICATDVATASVASTAVEASRARRQAVRRKPDWSLERTLAAVDRFVRAVHAHVVDGQGGLAELHALVGVHRRLTDVIDAVARCLLEHDDASYREVGATLGMSLQAVAKRYPGASSRPVGGQPGRLR